MAKKKKAKKKPAPKKAAKKKPAKKKAKAGARKSAAKKKPAKKNAAKKKAAKKPAAKKAAAKKSASAPRPSGVKAKVAALRKKPYGKRSLPAGAESIPVVYGKREKADKELTKQALKAALEAAKENPVHGKEFFGERTHAQIPKKGDMDYAVAEQMAEAVREVLAASDQALARDKSTQAQVNKTYRGNGDDN